MRIVIEGATGFDIAPTAFVLHEGSCGFPPFIKANSCTVPLNRLQLPPLNSY